jgi:hypothetical protein
VDDENSSDIVLATAELGVDADIAKHVKGHILLLWEEDDTEPIDLDEGIISINGEDVVPLYLNTGKMYVPFGRFESHLISDPLTLELGETRESAIVGGFGIDWIELSIGVFNGDIDKTGSDNQIESFVGGALFTLPEDKISGFGLAAGVYYISNIADSNGLQDIGTGVSAATVNDYVGGFSVFVSASFMDKFFLEAEYLGATGKFEAGELSFDGGEEFNPRTWNLELAFAPIDRLEIAGRYGGSGDCDNFLPNMQYGAAAIYGLFENPSLALEYLYSDFENDDKSSLITSQLAIEF